MNPILVRSQWEDGTKVRCTLRGALLSILLVCFASAHAQEASEGEVTLEIGNRTIHVFRGSLGAQTAQERAEAARHHIDLAIEREGEGWVSIAPVKQGYLVQLDNIPMFTVTEGDSNPQLGKTPEVLANAAARTLHKVWSEARERRNPKAALNASLRVLAAAGVLFLVMLILVRVSRWLRMMVETRLTGTVRRLSEKALGARFANSTLVVVARTLVVLTWLLELLAVFIFLVYSLNQFAFTRPIGQNLSDSLLSMLSHGLNSAFAALPGLFVALMIFLAARVVTQISRAVFKQVAIGKLALGTLDRHTAPATRQIVNAAVWLFAIAMAYPYLPGAQTEAFKGLSVILGIMVSIGAAGVVGQLASGMIIVFTRGLMAGDYVKVQDCEGMVTHVGAFVTRIRTALGEEVALPNSLVATNAIRNFSRIPKTGFAINASVSIGYDTAWRQVHALLLEAAASVPLIKTDPAPKVIQTALSDFYACYTLVAQVDTPGGTGRPQVTTDLNAAIQDVFNRNGVQIMSPHYESDPPNPKIVPDAP